MHLHPTDGSLGIKTTYRHVVKKAVRHNQLFLGILGHMIKEGHSKERALQNDSNMTTIKIYIITDRLHRAKYLKSQIYRYSKTKLVPKWKEEVRRLEKQWYIKI